MSADTLTKSDWPCDRESVRFQILTRPDHRGLQMIRALFWNEGRRAMRQHSAASLDALIASARRRNVVFDVVDESEVSEAA